MSNVCATKGIIKTLVELAKAFKVGLESTDITNQSCHHLHKPPQLVSRRIVICVL